MPSVLEVAEALADALENVSPQLAMTVEPRMVFAPAADACIDIFPANPAEGDLAFGKTPRIYWFTIRLRVPKRRPRTHFAYSTKLGARCTSFSRTASGKSTTIQ